ncbi:HIT family protein [Maritimibacter sp. 55A14]|uniref:HIT family protein n=1 Tax=Maritimibacter sp. 55A14 TaxID=2174844 RepID=UPI000D61D100|nr:HIT family protein [Maritimibacter sp. 55A14]PWE34020.1 HIT family protein [Maritimibacter sp. 55A14]
MPQNPDEYARNATFETFGGAETLIADYRFWSVQARPKQATLGAMILLAHGPAQSFAELAPGTHAELSRITADIESVAYGRFGCAKMNYLMLMMVDPHVHFHVLPRYEARVELDGIAFDDPGWPGPPDLAAAPDAPEAAARVTAALRAAWPA